MRRNQEKKNQGCQKLKRILSTNLEIQKTSSSIKYLIDELKTKLIS